MSVIFPREAFEAAAPLFSIREEMPSDGFVREALLDRAMGPGRTLKSSEAIRRGRLAADGLSFCAIDGSGHLVGTVRLWNVAAGTRDDAAVPALLLGPLAVAPHLKGVGIGGALMRRAIGVAAARGHGAILLVGDAAYYSRFGFSAAATGQFAMPGPFDPARLLARELVPGALDGVAGAVAATGRRNGATGVADNKIAAVSSIHRNFVPDAEIALARGT